MRGGEHSSGRRRHRRRRSHRGSRPENRAKDERVEGAEQEEANVGIVVAVAVLFLLALCLYYIAGEFDHEAPF
jgi:hypothetical protein